MHMCLFIYTHISTYTNIYVNKIYVFVKYLYIPIKCAPLH